MPYKFTPKNEISEWTKMLMLWGKACTLTYQANQMNLKVFPALSFVKMVSHLGTGMDEYTSLQRNRAVNTKSTPCESFPEVHVGVVNMSIPSLFTLSK